MFTKPINIYHVCRTAHITELCPQGLMCSINEGPSLEPRQPLPSERVCKKCREKPPAVVLRRKDFYCQEGCNQFYMQKLKS